jgi:hypothetical protein
MNGESRTGSQLIGISAWHLGPTVPTSTDILELEGEEGLKSWIYMYITLYQD